MVICLSFHTHVSKPLSYKSSPYTRDKLTKQTQYYTYAKVNFGLKMDFLSELRTVHNISPDFEMSFPSRVFCCFSNVKHYRPCRLPAGWFESKCNPHAITQKNRPERLCVMSFQEINYKTVGKTVLCIFCVYLHFLHGNVQCN